MGWIMVDVATAINVLHRRGIYHYGLAPDCILIHFDEKQNIPHVLLLDLGIASTKEALRETWYPFFVAPAYSAPELVPINGNIVRADFRTDVYGLGLSLYESLSVNRRIPTSSAATRTCTKPSCATRASR